MIVMSAPSVRNGPLISTALVRPAGPVRVSSREGDGVWVITADGTALFVSGQR